MQTVCFLALPIVITGIIAFYYRSREKKGILWQNENQDNQNAQSFKEVGND